MPEIWHHLKMFL